MRVLLLEDDKVTAKSIATMLKSEGCACDHADFGLDDREIGRLQDYDLIIIDLMLPNIGGYQVLRRLRAADLQAPILILSGLSEPDQPDDEVKKLEPRVADDLTEPFDKPELVARIQSIVRRSKGSSETVIETGMLSVNLNTCVVEVNGRPLHLPKKEYGILELLSLRKGTTLTKAMILTHLYRGMNEPDIKVIDVFVCKLRKRLSSATGGENYIETVWGRGYVLRDPLGAPHDRPGTKMASA